MEREDASETPGPGRKQDRRRLPPELAGLLPRKLEQGLDHVARRRILRALHKQQGEMSAVQLSRGPLEGVLLGTVSYHLNVLKKYDMVQPTRAAQNRGALERFYVSAVESDPLVLQVLTQTEGLDASQRAAGGEG
jgi:DNA-binding transcriptional ArsR family regulator